MAGWRPESIFFKPNLFFHSIQTVGKNERTQRNIKSSKTQTHTSTPNPSSEGGEGYAGLPGPFVKLDPFSSQLHPNQEKIETTHMEIR